jgi:cell division protein FtsW (lipid II flippase)
VALVTNIFAQALFNMSVALSLVPNKGIPLPFISAGGSSLLPTMIAVGLLLSISQYGVAPDTREETKERKRHTGTQRRRAMLGRSRKAWAR